MADVKSGLRTLQQPSTGDRNNIIDFVAIHGLNGSSTNTWVPGSNSATDLISAFFDDRSSDVRFSVYDWNLRTSPVDVFVLNNLREWCIKFLGDLASLRQGDPQSYPIVLLGHDLGATLIKEVPTAYFHMCMADCQRSSSILLTETARRSAYQPLASSSFGPSHRRL